MFFDRSAQTVQTRADQTAIEEQTDQFNSVSLLCGIVPRKNLFVFWRVFSFLQETWRMFEQVNVLAFVYV